MLLIRGVSKQVIVVKPEDSKIFEQAVFFVRPTASRGKVSNEAMLEEAARIIGENVEKYYCTNKKGFRLFNK